MKTFKTLLNDLNACDEAKDWAENKSIEDVISSCHRGDWMLWLAKRVDIPLQELTLAKGHCANTVRHLMKDERSIAAVDMAILFGNGKATLEDLVNSKNAATSAYAADDAYAAAYAVTSAYAAAYAAASAAAATSAYAAASAAAAYAATSAYAADDADAAAYAAAAYAAARKANQQQTADICRQYIGQLIVNKVNELLKS